MDAASASESKAEDQMRDENGEMMTEHFAMFQSMETKSKSSSLVL